MPAERKEFGDRGLGVYGDPITDTYHDQSGGTRACRVTVQDSSAAMYDAAWLRIEGEAHLDEQPRECAGIPFGVAQASVSAHLNVDKAKAIIEALSAWVERVEAAE